MGSKLSGLVFFAAVMAGLFLLRDGKPAPAFSLPKPYGGRVDLASYQRTAGVAGLLDHLLPDLPPRTPDARPHGT